jgi:thiamine pyrophosphokinase
MSSHHIVREKQEPALLFANGESCSENIIHQLLEWSPFVLVLDGAIERVLKLGIKVDLLSGDFDSNTIDLENLKKVQFPIEVIHTPDQNLTDLEKGIEILIERGFPAVNILWANGKRADHFISNLASIVKYQKDIKIRLIDDYGIVYPLNPLPAKFSKWFTQQANLSLIPFPLAEQISTLNLKYPLQNENLELGKRLGNSNSVEQTGIVEISYKSGVLLIMESND